MSGKGEMVWKNSSLLNPDSNIKFSSHTRVLYNQAPSNLCDLIVLYRHNRGLHCQTDGFLVVPRIFKSGETLAFSFQTPFLWCQLLVWSWETVNLCTFKYRLFFILKRSFSSPLSPSACS